MPGKTGLLHAFLSHIELPLSNLQGSAASIARQAQHIHDLICLLDICSGRSSAEVSATNHCLLDLVTFKMWEVSEANTSRSCSC